MSIFSKSKLLQVSIDDWRTRSLINDNTWETLTADVASRDRSWGFHTILVLLAAICLCFAAVTFVAANWEHMTRLNKTGLLLGSMAVAWLISIVCKFKGKSIYSQISVLVACALYGASIMLIAQMYHIQGEASDAVWLWGFGTLIAGAVTLSVPALCLSVGLFVIWHTMSFEYFHDAAQFNYGFLIYVLPSLALAIFLHSKWLFHITLLALSYWTVLSGMYELFDKDVANHLYSSIGGCFAAIALSLSLSALSKRLAEFAPALRFYAVALLVILLGTWFITQGLEPTKYNQDTINALRDITPWAYLPCLIAVGFSIIAWQHKLPGVYDAVVAGIFSVLFITTAALAPSTQFLAEIILLVFAIWLIRMALRLQERSLAILSYLAFAGYLLALYGITVGSLIGTAGFYALVGLILLASGILLPKLWKNTGGTS